MEQKRQPLDLDHIREMLASEDQKTRIAAFRMLFMGTKYHSTKELKLEGAELEEKAYELGKGKIPVQLLKDFKSKLII